MARKRKEFVEIKDLLVSGFDNEDVFAMILDEFNARDGTFSGKGLNLYKKRARVYAEGKVPIGSIIAMMGFWGTKEFMYPNISICEVKKDGSLETIYFTNLYTEKHFEEESLKKMHSEIAKVLDGKVKVIS